MAYWGDCGPARTTNKEYEEGVKRIFGEKEKTRREVRVLSPEQKKRQAMFPY